MVEFIALLWLVWGASWLLAARLGPAPDRCEAASSRLLHLGLLASCFVLLFGDALGASPLGRRFVAPHAPILWLAVAAVGAGLALAWWARLHLGGNWSGAVSLRFEHDLVRTGPYALVRHPIYVGILLAMAGTALAVGEWRGVLAVALGWLAFRRKARIEDRWLTERFGPVQDDYARSVRSGL